VIQWRWLEDVFPDLDQWNWIHERLVAKWTDLRPYVADPIHFAHDGYEEHLLTVSYLRDTAHAAGLRSKILRMKEIGWDRARECFVDLEAAPISTLFKLYPWETLLGERFGPHALNSIAHRQKPASGHRQWIEPIWKMLWSNKALLAILWELYPDHQLLLPSYLDSPRRMKSYVRKPLLGREGANITIVDGASSCSTDGRFEDGPWVCQSVAPVLCTGGNWAVLGSWLVDGEPCGPGIRESRTRVIRNLDRFVPHLFS
jgi:glutathionylspermidine synthase